MKLSGSQISLICQRHYHTRNTFAACTPWDKLPSYVHFSPSFYIIDVVHSLSLRKFGHWVVAFNLGTDMPMEFFCPLGRDPGYYNAGLVQFLQANGNGSYIYNNVKVQDNTSDSCGLYCLYICDLRNIGIKLEECVASLKSDDLKANDSIVENYVLKHMAK